MNQRLRGALDRHSPVSRHPPPGARLDAIVMMAGVQPSHRAMRRAGVAGLDQLPAPQAEARRARVKPRSSVRNFRPRASCRHGPDRNVTTAASSEEIQNPMPRDPHHDTLFKPVAIGPIPAKNRFYQVPHCNGMGRTHPTAMAVMRGIEAEGGWAAGCTEQCDIHVTTDTQREVRLWDDRDPYLARMAGTTPWQGSNSPTWATTRQTTSVARFRWRLRRDRFTAPIGRVSL